MRADFIKRKEKSRQKAEYLELYMKTHRVSKEDRERIHKYLVKIAANDGLIREFKEKGYL